MHGYKHFDAAEEDVLRMQMAGKYYEIWRPNMISSLALVWVGLSRVRNWQVNTGLSSAEEWQRLAAREVGWSELYAELRTWQRPMPGLMGRIGLYSSILDLSRVTLHSSKRMF